MISAGRTRHTANVMRASATADALGRRTNTFVNVGTVRCDVREQTAMEQGYADGVAVVSSFDVRVRWPNVGRLLITAADRLLWKGRTLKISGIRNLDQRNRVAVIDCTEVA